MGYIVEHEVGNVNHGIIDYATRYQSDFGDIYMSARCKFFLGSEGGLITIPWIFNVPVAYALSTGKEREWIQSATPGTWVPMEACNESARRHERVDVEAFYAQMMR